MVTVNSTTTDWAGNLRLTFHVSRYTPRLSLLSILKMSFREYLPSIKKTENALYLYLIGMSFTIALSHKVLRTVSF